MTSATPERAAEEAIESLRYGTPPPGRVLEFTVGRRHELDEIRATLASHRVGLSPAHLVKANYGSGKTHLLRVIREMALSDGYAVALITADAQGGVRFNRMEMVFSAVCRALELPDREGAGIRVLFDKFTECWRGGGGDDSLINRIEGRGWSWANQLESPGLWIALRAWVYDVGGYAKNTVENWLSFTFEHGTAHTDLHLRLVKARENLFNERRTSTEMKRDHVFDFRFDEHRQSWAALHDLDGIARASGYRGLVLLVDEFEDVIHNLNNVDFERKALTNLLRFFRSFGGLAYFAVTPDFLQKTSWTLTVNGRTGRFADLPSVTLSPVEIDDAFSLLTHVRALHADAYDWDALSACDDVVLAGIIDDAETSGDQAWLRSAIESTVACLDELLDA